MSFYAFQNRFPKGTKRSFNSMFEISCEVMNELYTTYLEEKVEYYKLFYVYSFLKMYIPIDSLHPLFNISYNTFNSSLWDTLNKIHEAIDFLVYSDYCHNFQNFSYNEKKVFGIIDTTECDVGKLVDNNAQNLLYSGYKKSHTYKYSVVTAHEAKFILDIQGSYFGPTDDKIAGMEFWCKELDHSNKMLMGNKKYFADYLKKVVLVEYDVGFNCLDKFKLHRMLIENINANLKNFNFLSTVSRYNSEKYELCFRVIRATLNIQYSLNKNYFNVSRWKNEWFSEG
jgi:hypothetical protein